MSTRNVIVTPSVLDGGVAYPSTGSRMSLSVTGPSSPRRGVDSVIAGWAGVENLDAQVSEWIDTTVERISGYEGGRIYEIGCGTGQLLARLAPSAECYWAADISGIAIDALRNNQPLPQVKLFQRPADDFSEIPDAHFDTVIINSVAQYFPDAAYLMRVIEGAIRALKPGGRLFLGDIQSHSLLGTHHAMALRDHAPEGATAATLREQVARRIEQETELSLDPDWFHLLASRLPTLAHTEILLRRGKLANETTTYHYDVVLHVGPPPATRVLPTAKPWGNLNIEQLEAMLGEGPASIHLTGIPDARLAVPLAFQNALAASPDDSTLPAVPTASGISISAEDLFAVAAQNGYRAHVRWKNDGSDGLLDAVFHAIADRSLPAWPKPAISKSQEELANTPYSGKSTDSGLTGALRQHLAASLPEYMIPSAFVVLEKLPLTPNGKVDRKALPAPPDTDESILPGTRTAPANETESRLLEIWKQVLGKEEIGTEDDIFNLGGDSILIFQITTRASGAGIAITPAMVFRLRNIAALAAGISTSSAETPAAASIQRVNRDAYRRNL